MARRTTRHPLGRHQLDILREAADEVSGACPWLTIDGDRRPVTSLSERGLVGATEDLFGIMPLGCWHLRRHDRPLARRALAGLRRNRDAGEVMPWDV